jgi:hypothetical protein
MPSTNPALVAQYGAEKAERIESLLAQQASARNEILAIVGGLPIPAEAEAMTAEAQSLIAAACRNVDNVRALDVEMDEIEEVLCRAVDAYRAATLPPVAVPAELDGEGKAVVP